MADVTDVFNPSRLTLVPENDVLLPNGGPWREAIDMDLRPFEWLKTFEGKGEKNSVRGKALLTVFIELGNGQEQDEWFRNVHPDLLSDIPGYGRSTCYEFVGLENKMGLAQYLTLHEFDTINHGEDAMGAFTDTLKNKKVLSEGNIVSAEIWEEIAVIGAIGTKL